MRNTTKLSSILMLLGAVMAPLSASATCWEEASNDYGIPVEVLKAVAKTESGFRSDAVNKNTDKTKDLGMMQINTRWIPTLSKFGIQEKDLFDACTNIKVGAWILSKNSEKLGWSWDAIGAYNVGCAKLDKAECARRRASYSWKVYAALQKKDFIAASGVSNKKGTQFLAAQVVEAAPRKTVAVTVSEVSFRATRIEPESFLAYAEVDGQDDE